MNAVSQDFLDIMAAGGHYEWRVCNWDNPNSGSSAYVIGKDKLISGTLTATAFDGLSIGNVIASQLDLTVRDITYDTSKPLYLQYRAVNDTQQSSWYKKGCYYFDTIDTSKYSGISKITAYDAILKTNYVYQRKGEWYGTGDYSIVMNIASTIGVSVDGNTQFLLQHTPNLLLNSPDIGEKGTTAMQLLSIIAAMRGGNWIIDYNGDLYLAILSETPLSSVNIGNAVADFDASDAETVSKVQIWLNSETYYALPYLPLKTHTDVAIETHGGETIEVRASDYYEEWDALSGFKLEANIPFYAEPLVASKLYTQFNGKTFYPYEGHMAFVPPNYEPIDEITVKDVTSLVADQTINIDALATSQIRFRAEETLNSLYPYITEFQRKTEYRLDNQAQLIHANEEAISQLTQRLNSIQVYNGD